MAKTTRKTTTRKTTKTSKPAVKQEESQTASTEVTDKQDEVPDPVEVGHPKAPELPKGKRKSSGVDQKKRPAQGGAK